MPVGHAILLGVVQGLTEFIPVSSTAHLALVQWLLGIRDADVALSFDLVLHLGTAAALILATWRTLVGVAVEAILWATGRPPRNELDRRLVLPIVVGTVPGVIAGLWLLKRMAAMRTPLSIGITMLVACAFFLVAERIGQASEAAGGGRGLESLTLADALWVGIAQALAGLFPGLSRSGTTISTGRLRGLERADATRFSFLLALPIILGAGAKALLDIARHRETAGPALGALPLAAGFLASALVGYLAVRFLLQYLRTHTLKPFAIYLAVLGTALIVASRFVTLG